jgi:hypothetical protein
MENWSVVPLVSWKEWYSVSMMAELMVNYLDLPVDDN